MRTTRHALALPGRPYMSRSAPAVGYSGGVRAQPGPDGPAKRDRVAPAPAEWAGEDGCSEAQGVPRHLLARSMGGHKGPSRPRRVSKLAEGAPRSPRVVTRPAVSQARERGARSWRRRRARAHKRTPTSGPAKRAAVAAGRPRVKELVTAPEGARPVGP